LEEETVQKKIKINKNKNSTVLLLEQEQVIRIPRAVEDRLSCAQRAVRLSIHSSTTFAKMTKRETPFNHPLPTFSHWKWASPPQRDGLFTLLGIEGG